ncbi:MAG: ATP phosphoribosyltransferase regulatory subunit [Clostridiales bacterium]|jgi:ATP phosphoribosyltransferase regulatory subunit|nr:ATP phosphoribosyltransferase regulatory subunit [Clostridiales bacterium]
MRKWKTHTPEGAFDLLEHACARKRGVEDKITRVYRASGYFEVQTPTFEFYDVFADESGDIDQGSMMKFFDRNGRILVLRPDFTTPIARLCATKYADAVFPKRLSYTGSAFRDGDGGASAGAVQKEFTQAGIELIGQSSPDADAEVIAVTIRALLSCGLEEFQIDIGQAEFFKGIMEQTGLDDDMTERMRRLIDKKSFVAVGELADGYQIDKELKSLILELPNLFGGIEVVERIKTKPLGSRAKRALDNLMEIYRILADYGFEKYVSIDLGMVQGLNYYTGVIVKGFTYGVGFPVCGGGRYDNLIGDYGKGLPATGVAIGIERVISALCHKANAVEEEAFDLPAVHTLVCFGEARETAFKIAEGLRGSGLCVEMWLGGGGAEEYAARRGIGGIVRVKDAETIEIVNLRDGETTETTLSGLLGGDGV